MAVRAETKISARTATAKSAESARKLKPRAGSLQYKWVFFFSLWLFLLSGLLTDFVGTPGILQVLRLRKLLETKRERLAQSEKQLSQLRTEAEQLDKNSFTQEREVRRILGYAAPDEIIFDFNF